MRLGKTISNKFDCFALNFHYLCHVFNNDNDFQLLSESGAKPEQYSLP